MLLCNEEAMPLKQGIAMRVPDKVGWPWQVRAMSSAEAPYSMASTHSPISSPVG